MHWNRVLDIKPEVKKIAVLISLATALHIHSEHLVHNVLSKIKFVYMYMHDHMFTLFIVRYIIGSSS